MSDYLLTPEDLVREIGGLRREVNYGYIDPKQHGFIKIIDVRTPSGPIYFKRVNSRKGETLATKKAETISSGLLNRVARSISVGIPLSIDRAVGASYNARSVLEALLAYTPMFYVCYPGRYEDKNGRRTVQRGHKHLLYLPEKPHPNGVKEISKSEIVISEHSSVAVHESVALPATVVAGTEAEKENYRMHIVMQDALRKIGLQLGYKTYIAKDNQSVLIKDKPLGSLDGVVTELSTVTTISHNPKAVHAGRTIDCVWFRNGSLMPAVFEVEHTTGITSGLSRMMTFWEHVKGLQTRWVIVAPDEDEPKAISEILKPQFRNLEARYMSYSNVERLLVLAQEKKLNGITQQFLDGWMVKPDFPNLPPIIDV
jgi:type II restriction enzyme